MLNVWAKQPPHKAQSPLQGARYNGTGFCCNDLELLGALWQPEFLQHQQDSQLTPDNAPSAKYSECGMPTSLNSVNLPHTERLGKVKFRGIFIQAAI